MDNRGSTLIENVISIFLLTLFAAMASFGIIAGMNALTNASLENQRLYDVYSLIESGQRDPDKITSRDHTFTFTIENGSNYTIDGKIYYDKEKEILGEFVRTE